jgi:hypothetical protein
MTAFRGVPACREPDLDEPASLQRRTDRSCYPERTRSFVGTKLSNLRHEGWRTDGSDVRLLRDAELGAQSRAETEGRVQVPSLESTF